MALLNKKLFTTNQSIKTLLIRGVILVVLGIAQVWIWPAVTTRVNDFQQKRFQTQQIQQLHDRLNVIRNNQRAQQDLLSQLDLVVPRQSSLAQVIERLERVAIERGVKLKVSDIKDNPTGASSQTTTQATLPITPVTIAAQVTGSSQQLLQYLDAIEHLQELTVVSDWTLGTTTQGQSGAPGTPASSPVPTTPNTYSMSLNVTFWLQTTNNAPK